MPIGTIFSHVSSNPPAGAVLLSGQTLAQSDYTEFYNYIKNNTDNIRVISNDDYEAEISGYGFCGAFVINDVEKTVRLPNYKNAFLMGGNSTNNGTAVEAGLPNIAGRYAANDYGDYPIGAYYLTSIPHTGDYRDVYIDTGVSIGFDASRGTVKNNNGAIDDYTTYMTQEESPYGKSDTVQPPAICVNYYIQVYNSTYTPNMVEAALKDLSNVDSKFDFVIKSEHKADGSWYRIYRSGWIEQGGIYTPTKNLYQESHTIKLCVPLTKLYDSKFTLVYGKAIGGAINFYLTTLPSAAIIETIDMFADSSSASITTSTGGKLLWSVQGMM